MIKINIHEAKTHLSRYLARVAKGEINILCKHNPDRNDEDVLSCQFEKKIGCTSTAAIYEVGENIDKRWPQ